MTVTESILHFVEQYSEWAIAVAFMIAFLESMAVIGILIPGWLLLVGIGTLIGANSLDFYPVVIGAYAGAVIGEYLSYLLGLRFREDILTWRLLLKYQETTEHGLAFFKRHGIAGVFFGRFFGPTRAIVPLIAGIAGMRQTTFLWVNLLSGLFWAPLYLIPGIMIGAAFGLEAQDKQSLFLILLTIVICAFIAVNSSIKLRKKMPIGSDMILLTKFSVSWGITIAATVIFMRSHYFEIVINVFDILVKIVA